MNAKREIPVEKVSKLVDIAYPREISSSQRIRGGARDELAGRRERERERGISIFEVNIHLKFLALLHSAASFNDVPDLFSLELRG